MLQPGGVFAAWGYGLAQIAPAVDAAVLDCHATIVGPWWPPDRRHLEDRYQSLPFPLDPLSVPEFSMTARWGLDDLLGYLDTRSGHPPLSS